MGLLLIVLSLLSVILAGCVLSLKSDLRQLKKNHGAVAANQHTYIKEFSERIDHNKNKIDIINKNVTRLYSSTLSLEDRLVVLDSKKQDKPPKKVTKKKVAKKKTTKKVTKKKKKSSRV